VQVQQVRFVPLDQLGQLTLGPPVADRRGREQDLLRRAVGRDLVRAAQERHHVHAGRAQLGDLRVDDDVLAGGLGGGVAVVSDDDSHGAVERTGERCGAPWRVWTSGRACAASSEDVDEGALHRDQEGS
jgi:hypothetical protein